MRPVGRAHDFVTKKHLMLFQQAVIRDLRGLGSRLENIENFLLENTDGLDSETVAQLAGDLGTGEVEHAESPGDRQLDSGPLGFESEHLSAVIIGDGPLPS